MLNAFEFGDKPSAPIDMVMRVAAVLDVTVVLTPPEPPKSAGPVELIDLDVHLRRYDEL